MQTTEIKEYLKDFFDDRLEISDIASVLEKACTDYRVGKLRDYRVSKYGFQDVNVKLVTEQGRYFCKLFGKDESRAGIENYLQVMQQAYSGGINYPKLLESSQGNSLTVKAEGKDITLCMQEYIDGKSFYEYHENPSEADLAEIARQAAVFNRINYRPREFELDTWATLKFPEMYLVKKEALTKVEDRLVEPLLAEFEKIPFSNLPKVMVHGDIIRTNVIKDRKGKIWIIDLGVVNYQPRIVELAVMAHDLFLDLTSVERTGKLRVLMIKNYELITKLTPGEKAVLPILIKVTQAMYLMSAAFMERSLGHGSEEISFWLNQSREALRKIENELD